MDIFVGRNESVQQPVMDDLNKFIDFLSSLLTTCEKVKVDMQTVKRDLRRAKTEAVALKAKAVEDRTVLAAANITFGLAAAVSIFSGGLALPILLGTGQLMTTICANEVNKHYNNRVMQIIRAVDHRSENATHRARAVINKRNAYKSTINRLQLSGFDENLAIFYAVCASIFCNIYAIFA